MVNRTQALAHNDALDREVTKDFLEQNKWYGIELGDTYDLDLEVHEFNRGCDVEMINYGMDRFKQHNHFRIPVRKHPNQVWFLQPPPREWPYFPISSRQQAHQWHLLKQFGL